MKTWTPAQEQIWRKVFCVLIGACLGVMVTEATFTIMICMGKL